MEIGNQKVEGFGLDMKAIQVQENGRIPMLANFRSMQELWGTLDEAVPKIAFLRN